MESFFSLYQDFFWVTFRNEILDINISNILNIIFVIDGFDVMFNDAKRKKSGPPNKQNVVNSKPHIYRSSSHDPSCDMSYRKKAAEISQFPSIYFFDTSENLLSPDTQTNLNVPKRSYLFKHRTFDLSEKSEESKQPLMIRRRSIPLTKNRSYPLDEDLTLDQHTMHDGIDLDRINSIKYNETRSQYNIEVPSEIKQIRNNLLRMTEEEYDVVLNQC